MRARGLRRRQCKKGLKLTFQSAILSWLQSSTWAVGSKCLAHGHISGTCEGREDQICLSPASFPDLKKNIISFPSLKKAVSSLHASVINISVQRVTAQAWFIFTHVHICIGSLSKTIIMVPTGFQPPSPSWEASAVKTAWMIFWSRGVHICAWLAQQ